MLYFYCNLFCEILYIQLYNYYLFLILAAADCSCSTFVNRNGYGNCRNISSSFGVRCYVNQPSSCLDLKGSLTDPEKQLSAQACIGKLL